VQPGRPGREIHQESIYVPLRDARLRFCTCEVEKRIVDAMASTKNSDPDVAVERAVEV
jgi:hypothetical protein